LQVRFTFGKIPNAFWTQVRIETNRTFRTFARTLSSCMTQNSCVARSSRPNCQQRWIMIYFFCYLLCGAAFFLTTTQPGTSQSAIPADARLAPTPTVITLLMECWRAVFRIRRCMRESVYSGVLNSDGLAVRLAVVNHNAASAVMCQLVHDRLRSAIWCADAAVVELIWSVYETTASVLAACGCCEKIIVMINKLHHQPICPACGSDICRKARRVDSHPTCLIYDWNCCVCWEIVIHVSSVLYNSC